MKVVAIIQARMGSSRLPGKVLMDIAGRSMLARVVERVQQAPGIHEVIVATTTCPADDAVAAEAERLGVASFRGSEQNVLDRYYQCAGVFQGDVIVRVTADCPLLDAEVTGRVVGAFLQHQPDYASTGLEPTYPRGLDTEVFSMAALTKAWREASKAYQREHVTPYIYEHPRKFRLLSVKHPRGDFSQYRWTVDTPEDMALVRQIYARLGPSSSWGWREGVALMAANPQLTAINGHIRQKAYTESGP